MVTAQRWRLSFSPPAEQSVFSVGNKKRGEKKKPQPNDDQAFSWPDEHDASFTFCSEDITFQMQLSWVTFSSAYLCCNKASSVISANRARLSSFWIPVDASPPHRSSCGSQIRSTIMNKSSQEDLSLTFHCKMNALIMASVCPHQCARFAFSLKCWVEMLSSYSSLLFFVCHL